MMKSGLFWRWANSFQDQSIDTRKRSTRCMQWRCTSTMEDACTLSTCTMTTAEPFHSSGGGSLPRVGAAPRLASPRLRAGRRRSIRFGRLASHESCIVFMASGNRVPGLAKPWRGVARRGVGSLSQHYIRIATCSDSRSSMHAAGQETTTLDAGNRTQASPSR